MPAYQLTWRTDDLTAWGYGKGANLTPVEVDQNFWNINYRLLALEGSTSAKQIDYIAESNGALFVHYTDHTIDGPFDLPSATFRWRGAWTASTLYSVFDIVLVGGTTIYLVTFEHTSGAVFDPGSSESGNDYYQLMLKIPAIPVKTVADSTYIPTLADANTYIRMTYPSPVFYLPNSTTVPYDPYTELHVHWAFTTESGGTGLFLLGASGVTVNYPGGYTNQISVSHGTVGAKLVDSNVWDVWGLFTLA